MASKKKCPKCGKFKDVELVTVQPTSFQLSGSYYCWKCHIYIKESGKEDIELMKIMLEVEESDQ